MRPEGLARIPRVMPYKDLHRLITTGTPRPAYTSRGAASRPDTRHASVPRQLERQVTRTDRSRPLAPFAFASSTDAGQVTSPGTTPRTRSDPNAINNNPEQEKEDKNHEWQPPKAKKKTNKKKRKICVNIDKPTDTHSRGS